MAFDSAHPESRAEPDSGSVCLQITYFTDPLCCWSWGFEPQLRRLRYAYAGRIAWRIRMGGMIGDWNQFEDPLNAIHRPSQMGPLWLQAKHVTGMPVEANIWVEDPPSSSWPSCLAVKAAELQSAIAADLYLRRVREAVMTESRNIARREVLLELASELEDRSPELFDHRRFAEDLDSAEAGAALKEDVKEARFRGVGRFPCLAVHRPGEAPRYLVGWRPYAALRDAIVSLSPLEIGPERKPASAEAYRTFWGRITDREIAEVSGREMTGDFGETSASVSSGFGR